MDDGEADLSVVNKDFWLSYKGHTVDALAPKGDEGRGYRRNAPVRRKQPLTR